MRNDESELVFSCWNALLHTDYFSGKAHIFHFVSLFLYVEIVLLNEIMHNTANKNHIQHTKFIYFADEEAPSIKIERKKREVENKNQNSN